MRRIFDNYSDSYHDEIASYYPAWYRDVFEMDAVWQVAGAMLDTLRSDFARVFGNAFVQSADNYAITRLEAFLGVVSAATSTLADRRAFLAALYSEHGGVSAESIRRMIREITGYASSVALDPPELAIGIDCVVLTALTQDSLTRALARALPAHLKYAFTFSVSISDSACAFGTLGVGGNIALAQTT